MHFDAYSYLCYDEYYYAYYGFTHTIVMMHIDAYSDYCYDADYYAYYCCYAYYFYDAYLRIFLLL